MVAENGREDTLGKDVWIESTPLTEYLQNFGVKHESEKSENKRNMAIDWPVLDFYHAVSSGRVAGRCA